MVEVRLVAPHEAVVPAPRTAAPASPSASAPTPVRFGRPRWRVLREPVVLLATDVTAVVASLAASHVPLRRSLLLCLVMLTLFARDGLHRARLTMSVLDDLPTYALDVCAAIGGSAVLLVVLQRDRPVRPLVLEGALVAVAVLLGRVGSYATVRWARRNRRLEHRTLVLGSGSVGQELADAMLEYGEYGLRPVGFLDDAGDRGHPLVPHLGPVALLPAAVEAYRVRNVVVAFSQVPSASLVEALHACDGLGVEIYTVPRLFEVHTATGRGDRLRGIPLERLRRSAFRAPTWPLKRVFDLTAAGAALLIVAPLLAACALAVRLDGGPGVIFRQERVGLGGRRFTVLKFRTLRPADEGESATRWSIAQDGRVSPLGRLMRRLSLDELPQLWNILRGDMSVVGPRPERPHFADQFGQEHEEYGYRHRVPCGLTGWAQVHGLRGDTSIGQRARFDNYYIENWSFWLDLQIVLRTLAQVLTAGGA